jgi:hypothetical protein
MNHGQQTVELGEETREFLRGLVGGDTEDDDRLDALIAMVQQLSHLPAEVALLVERVNIIHELVSRGAEPPAT